MNKDLLKSNHEDKEKKSYSKEGCAIVYKELSINNASTEAFKAMPEIIKAIDGKSHGTNSSEPNYPKKIFRLTFLRTFIGWFQTAFHWVGELLSK